MLGKIWQMSQNLTNVWWTKEKGRWDGQEATNQSVHCSERRRSVIEMLAPSKMRPRVLISASVKFINQPIIFNRSINVLSWLQKCLDLWHFFHRNHSARTAMIARPLETLLGKEKLFETVFSNSCSLYICWRGCTFDWIIIWNRFKKSFHLFIVSTLMTCQTSTSLRLEDISSEAGSWIWISYIYLYEEKHQKTLKYFPLSFSICSIIVPPNTIRSVLAESLIYFLHWYAAKSIPLFPAMYYYPCQCPYHPLE